MVHRGPDSGRVVSLGPLVLGHRRLAIIDTSAENDQPQFDATRNICIACNGEIYNFRELRHFLETKGISFRTNGDTEVILAAYRYFGVDFLQHLNGMFAIALWDAANQRLLLARDRVGEKPLFYVPLPEGVIFASEPLALRKHALVSHAIDPVGLAHYLALNYVPGDRSLTVGMRKVPPAHYMVFERSTEPALRAYWDLAPHFRNKRSYPSIASAADELQCLIDDSVRLRMISDVPLGAFLSGGVDSSTVVASMTRQHAGDVKTFTVGFGEKGFDETAEAQSVAEALGSIHYEERLHPTADEWLPSLFAASGEPLADTSTMPTWFLSKFSRKQVVVALSGDGGDELFAGYDTYIADRFQMRLGRTPQWLVNLLRMGVNKLVPVTHGKVSFDYKARQFLAGLKLPFERAHYSWRMIFDQGELHALLRPEWRRLLAEPDADAFATFARHFQSVQGCDPVDQAMYVDIKTWLADDLLVKADRATMAHSLESRAPFLDHRIIEFSASLPVEYKLRGLRKKYLLKMSQAGRLPGPVLTRRKRGFNAPVSRWLAGPLQKLARDAIYGAKMLDWFNRPAIDQLFEDHLAFRRDNGYRLFGLLCLALWMENL